MPLNPVSDQKLRMMAALLRDREQPKNYLQSRFVDAPPASNWLSKPLPMEGRASLLPMRRTDWPMMGNWEWALPGAVAGAVNAFTAPGRALRQPGFDTQQEAQNFALTFTGGGAAGSRMAPVPRGSVGMNAFHGSPHKFDTFDISKIGTGEGAQAYGHGLYFAENPGVARSYVTAGQIDAVIDNKPVSHFYSNSGAQRGSVDELAQWVDSYRSKDSVRTALSGRRDDLLKLHDEMVNAGRLKYPEGNLYHVDIPDEAVAKMLDWDKPLSEQPQAVREGWVRAMQEYMRRTPNVDMSKLTGEQAYNMLSGGASGMHGYEQFAALASGALKKAGVPGIRYLDAGSRGAGQGTRNIVLFDDKLARITKRE